MGQKKLQRFAEIKDFPNVFEFDKSKKGHWSESFGNSNPITLELACGKGEYALGLGRMYPQKNFIGVDIKGNRIWRGAKTALEEKLNNVAFLRTEVDQLMDYFDKGEVNEIWITFPDPQLRFSKIKKRLTHPKFLRIYQVIISHNGELHLKTDSPVLYQFTKTVINFYQLQLLIDDNNASASQNPELKIKTHYESLDIAKSNRVYYLKFLVNKDLPKEYEEKLKQTLNEQPVG